jgi:hypothetical protein
VKFKVLFLDGPRAQVIFVVNPGLFFFLNYSDQFKLLLGSYLILKNQHEIK